MNQGFSVYLCAKLASFYECAGQVTKLGSLECKGSISIINIVSPSGGDFSDSVINSIFGIVQMFWGLDKKLVQQKYFLLINISVSYSKYITIDKFYTKEYS